MLFLLRSVVISLYTALRSADLSKRNPEIQASQGCLQRTLCKDSNDSFNEVTRNF